MDDEEDELGLLELREVVGVDVSTGVSEVEGVDEVGGAELEVDEEVGDGEASAGEFELVDCGRGSLEDALGKMEVQAMKGFEAEEAALELEEAELSEELWPGTTSLLFPGWAPLTMELQ